MSFTQLHPQIPLATNKGKGFAIGVIDYSQDHDLIWVIMLDNGEIWCVENSKVRAVNNFTLGRMNDTEKR